MTSCYLKGNTDLERSYRLIADNSTWLVQIPSDLAAGNYVLRHEIIALHSAESEDGAQNYPQCFNLAVSGTGTEQPSGVLGTALYQETDPGILYNIYTSVEDYTMPGPAEYTGFSSSVAQSSSVATATSSAVTDSGVTASTAAATTSSSSVASTAAQTTSSSAAATTSSSAVASTTLTTAVTSSVAATTSAAAVGQSEYGQCGGSAWTGLTACATGTCTTLNDYYAQCI